MKNEDIIADNIIEDINESVALNPGMREESVAAKIIVDKKINDMFDNGRIKSMDDWTAPLVEEIVKSANRFVNKYLPRLAGPLQGFFDYLSMNIGAWIKRGVYYLWNLITDYFC